MHTARTNDIRKEFAHLLETSEFVSNKKDEPITTIEIMGASFWADEDVLFGKVNDYVHREEEWYKSQSLNIWDIPGGKPPAAWIKVADKDGYVNSNYGWCVWHADNYHQFANVINELSKNPGSRRAQMIYTRPSMWVDYNQNGRNDFMCTNCVTYYVRDGLVNAVVQMRSNDAVFGYKNDFFWQKKMIDAVADALGKKSGKIYWQVCSLHVYSTHYYLIEHYIKTGVYHITPQAHAERYPESPFKLIDQG